jgi:hypothetical protein
MSSAEAISTAEAIGIGLIWLASVGLTTWLLRKDYL